MKYFISERFSQHFSKCYSEQFSKVKLVWQTVPTYMHTYNGWSHASDTLKMQYGSAGIMDKHLQTMKPLKTTQHHMTLGCCRKWSPNTVLFWMQCTNNTCLIFMCFKDKYIYYNYYTLALCSTTFSLISSPFITACSRDSKIDLWQFSIFFNLSGVPRRQVINSHCNTRFEKSQRNKG